jgi:nucleoid DNA-binding protein
MNIDVEKFLDKIAHEEGISKVHAEIIYRSIFEMIADTMRKGDAENILLPKFGKFIVPRKKLQMADPDKYEKKYGVK